MAGAGLNERDFVMLILERRKGESVIIITPDGDRIVVMLIAVGDRTKLAFEADPKYRIIREEIEDD